MASAAQRAWAARGRAEAASAPASTRILSSVDRSRGTTKQDLVRESKEKASSSSTPSTQPQVEAGMIGGVQVVMPAHVQEQIIQPSLPESIHATQPTILIHGKTPSDYGAGVVRYNDVQAISAAIDYSKGIDEKIGEHIPSLTDVQRRGAEFRERYPETANVLYTTLEQGATIVKAPIGFMEDIEATPKKNSIHSQAPITSAPPALRQVLLEQQQRDYGAELAKTYAETGKAVGEYSVERYGMFETQPLQTIGTEIVVPYAVGAGIGAGFKVGTYGTRLVLKKGAGYVGTETLVGKGLTFTSKAVEPTVALVTTGQIGHKFIQADTQKQRVEMVAELGVGLAGAAKGWSLAGKGIETIRVRGRTEVPIESIIEPEVLSGVESFPMTRKGETPTQLISRFKESEFKLPIEKDGTFVWHAAPETLGKSSTVFGKTVRGSDVPGLYTSPSLSPYFLRVTEAPKASLYSRLFGSPEPLEPTALRIGVKDVTRLPESVRYDVGKASEYLKTDAPKGEATLTPVLETALRGKGKAEAEAVITPETLLGRVEQKYFVKIEGHKVPIDTYKVGGIGKKFDTAGKVKTPEVIASKLAKTESYKRYQEGIFKPSYYTPGRSTTGVSVIPSRAVDSRKVVSTLPRRPNGRRDVSYIGSISDRVPRTPREPRITIGTVYSYVIQPSEPRRPVPDETIRTPKEQLPYTMLEKIKTIEQIKKEKNEKKKPKSTKTKDFQYFIENPIASPFGNSIRKVK